MNILQSMSIKSKLVMIIVGVSFTISFVGLSIVFASHSITLRDNLKNNAILDAELVGQYCVVPLTFHYVQEANGVLNKLSVIPSIVNACVYDENGDVFAMFNKKDSKINWPDIPAPNDFNDRSKTEFFENGFLHLFHSIIYQKKHYGTLYLRVETSHLKDRITEELLFLLPVAFMLLLCAYFIAGKLQRPISGPIHKLADVAQNLAATKDYSIRVETKSGGEIGILYHRFNYLCERIELREKERDVAEKKLLELNKDLEHRIKKRTADLERLNHELKLAKITADEANVTKSAFLANMSHEIRTPMNAITGLTYLAMQTELTPQQQDYLVKIESSASLLLGIVNDILDFSKIEAGKLEMESINFYLDDVFEKVSSIIAVKAAKKNLEFLFDTRADVPQRLVGDPLRLSQVLTNLVGNALKFTEKGEVIVYTRLIEQKKIEQKGGRQKENDEVIIQFSVRDTGIGMPKENARHLFKAFTQADSSITRKFGGTGLGLVICKQLIEMMGGGINVQSEVGKGSTFTFTAKFGQHYQEKKEPLPTAMNFNEMNALVVDDNNPARQMLKQMLESIGFPVITADSGKEALRIFQARQAENKPVDLILMDLKMPEMDGIETSIRIKDNLKLSRVPIIIMVTADESQEALHRAQQAGLDGFIAKPVTASTIFDKIMDAMGQKPDFQKTDFSNKHSNKQISEMDFDQIKGAKILLAEDNEINQQVACELLTHLGMEVTVAQNGKSAVDLVQTDKYDAVLMDIQMPEMDGLTATRKIRELDSTINTIPIIAQTAHAMEGDREKSLKAGMNDHVTKPLDPEELLRTLIKWIKPKEKPARPVHQPPDEPVRAPLKEIALPELPGFDIPSALARVGGNQDLLVGLLKKFAGNYANAANEIETAMEKGDYDDVRMLTHTLKGVAGNMGAVDLQKAAELLEAAAKEDVPGEQTVRFDAVREQLARALNSIRRIDRHFEKNNDAGVESCPDPENDPKENPAIPDIAKITPALLEMKQLLESNSFNAGKHAALLSSLLKNTSVFEEINKMEKSLSRYDFKAALVVLENMAKTLHISLTEKEYG